jgi:uncharacterized protein
LIGMVLVLLMIVGSVSIYRYVSFYGQSVSSSARSFSVRGEGKVVAVPDVAVFSFQVISQGSGVKDVSKLQEDNTKKVNQAIEFVKTSGIDDKDIKTESYSLEPRYQYYPCVGNGPCRLAEIVGYTIRQSVSVKVRDFGKIGELLTGVVDRGANSVSDVRFTIDDLSELKAEAREEAIAKAQTEAKNIARAGGFSLGKLLSLDESWPYYPEPVYGRGGTEEMLKSDMSVTPVLEPGSEEISVTVNLRYEIK